FFQAEDGIRDFHVTGVQTCALPIFPVLVFAGTLDPATPAVDAYQTIRFLDNATLVEVEGAAHAPMGLDACTRGIATAFIDAPGKIGRASCREGVQHALAARTRVIR